MTTTDLQAPAQPATGYLAASPPPALRRTGAAGIARLALLSLVLALGNAAAFAAGKAAVAAPDEYGARIAMEVMGHGGNAVDAAVATAFVLAVTYPEAGNLGGGGFMMIYRDGKPACLDYRETAPAAATRDMYLDSKGAVIKNSSTIGPLAAGVPGTVAGMWLAHQRYGKRPWSELLQPAIKLARDGIEPSQEMAKRIREAHGSYAGITNFDDYFGAVQAGKLFRAEGVLVFGTHEAHQMSQTRCCVTREAHLVSAISRAHGGQARRHRNAQERFQKRRHAEKPLSRAAHRFSVDPDRLKPQPIRKL